MIERISLGRRAGGFFFPGSWRSGFTVIEVLIALVVLGLLSTSFMMLYRQSMESYRLTTWKQERTRQAEIFWNRLRKPLEEASDQLERQAVGPANWTILRHPRPLLYRPEPGDGVCMAWQIDHYHVESGTVQGPDTWKLSRQQDRLRLIGPDGGEVAGLEDVASMSIRATPITQRNGTFEEELAGTGEVVGSVLEIFLVLRPPPSQSFPEGVRLVQNAKFKLVVGSEVSANPNY